MAGKGRIFVILSVVFIVLSLGLSASAYLKFQQEKTKNAVLQRELEVVKKKQDASEKELVGSRKIAEELGAKLKETQGKLDEFTTQVTSAKNTKQKAVGLLSRMNTDLKKQKALWQELEIKFNQAQEGINRIQAQLSELENKKAELENKIKDLESKLVVTKEELPAVTTAVSETVEEVKKDSGVELGTIVVSPEIVTPQVSAAQTPPAVEIPNVDTAQVTAPVTVPVEEPKKDQETAIEGKVLVINRDYNFAVINLGSKDKINTGDEFVVFHQDKEIGQLKVEKVHDSMSAAEFSSPEMRDKVNEGDRVVRKAK